MVKHIQSIRGMHDVLPIDTPVWQHLESQLRALMAQYGYHEIRTPIVEQTALFKRAVGEVTDIVEKEMYTFEDRNGDSLSLRPEGTASCVRAGIEHGLLYNQQQRLWYMGAMFRHERPQKGRQRQFHQMGVESFGFASPEMDAELIMMAARLWRQLGVSDVVQLEINSLGSSEARAAYRAVLIDYFEAHVDLLDDEAKARLHSNPLRILDTKNPAMQSLVEAAPKLKNYLDEESATEFAMLKNILDHAGVKYIENERLVRGLDYYNKCVFEWTTDKLGAQGTICAGGRYDGLVEQLGGHATPAAGFGMGLERLVLLLEEMNQLPQTLPADAFVIALDTAFSAQAMHLSEQMRKHGLNVVYNCGGGGMKSQMKKADKSGARFALIVGEEEIQNRAVTLKDLRGKQAQQTVNWDDVAGTIKGLIR